MTWPLVRAVARLLIGWATVVLFFTFGDAWLADLTSSVKATAVFLWLLGVIIWCAFGVVEQERSSSRSRS